MTSALPAPLIELASGHGVATEFWDWQGNHRQVEESTIRTVLGALGIPAQDDDQVAASLRARREDPWRRVLPTVTVIRSGRSHRLPVHLPVGTDFRARVRLEDSGVLDLEHSRGAVNREVDGAKISELEVLLPGSLPLGWHAVELVVGAGERKGNGDAPTHSMPLVVAPEKLELPEFLRGDGDQGWGVMTQLYAMRSRQSWGTGDLADLADLGAWAAGLGADFVLVNPLHAAEPHPPMEPSPYLPTTRRFANPIYIRVEDVPEVAYLSAAERQLVEWHADDAQRFLDLDFLERDAVWAGKQSALLMVFRQGRSVRRERAFHAFIEREGQGLVDYATWATIFAIHGPDWREWPEELRDPRSEAVEKLRQDRSEQVEFQCWLQWVLADQLAGVQRDLRETGMRLGVMHDLAVGVHPHGADTWSLGDALARDVTVGAPADQYNQLGQNWSQPPWRPDKLAELGYAPYRDMIRAALRDAGGLRIDHVIGLFRLWWIPEGTLPREGTYVRYDHEAMVGILMLEAHRAGAVVVGEDLGTVEPWVRDYLSEAGILGTSILWFEKDYDGDGGLLPPESYRELCLATVTTHDLPPTAGYLQGVHIDLRHSLGLLNRPLEEEKAADEADREQVLADLRRRGLLREGAGVAEQVEALHRFLSFSRAKLLGVSVSDLAQDTRVINQPGTDEEYPNWRVPLAGPEGRPVMLEELFTWRSARRLARTVSREA
ncbi:4-alpha-glucanotransferase [Ornithinimicrobium ciconiae]|uniref:4-alpha-glucanotransferase n=1 Tax=Ornithinimicrobium ciconiae TaxID=2594265 RepID=A0A516GCX0_9MICO|nr:4-alpha-glucanotransferase [Ornithinimicrobium ciconiae]QDO89376.1 4-alpha-glucanotransferase [Ornithinimicrobium ciconiae]